MITCGEANKALISIPYQRSKWARSLVVTPAIEPIGFVTDDNRIWP